VDFPQKCANIHIIGRSRRRFALARQVGAVGPRLFFDILSQWRIDNGMVDHGGNLPKPLGGDGCALVGKVASQVVEKSQAEEMGCHREPAGGPLAKYRLRPTKYR